MWLEHLAYWKHKSHDDNAWRPRPGQDPTHQSPHNRAPSPFPFPLPPPLRRTDLSAAVVDVAPGVAGIGAVAHGSQVFAFGFTAPASVFRNARTLTAVHRAVLGCGTAVGLAQAMGWEYRDWIPRWAHARERRRDEGEVRRHVDAGMAMGAVAWVGRVVVWRVGRRYWAPIEVVMGGGLADLMHREYGRAHNF